MSQGLNNPAYADPKTYGMHAQQTAPGQIGVQMQPVQQQPGQQPGVQWMAQPQGFSGCPQGLEYLTQVDQLVVKQVKDLIEVFFNYEQQNKYRIMNSVGQQVYFAQEDSECLERQCCGPARGFTMKITDNAGNEVIRILREFKCCAGCCWCADSLGCAMTIQIEAPPGTPVGYVRQEKSGWTPHYTIRTPGIGTEDQCYEGTVIGRIRGPCCQCSGPCCDDVEFPITNDGEDAEIGKIAKHWAGWQEFFTDADTFSVKFPIDMDVRAKAAFIGATFLIDFMYFEQKQNNNS